MSFDNPKDHFYVLSTLKIKSMRLIMLFVFVFQLGLSLSGQSSKTGNWLMYFGNQSINKNWNLHNEIQYRNYNLLGDTEQLLLRTGIGYNLSEKNNNVLAGYAFIRSHKYVSKTEEKFSFDEHRIFQQFINRHSSGKLFFQHRFRLEERILQNDFRLRFRYFLAVNIPLNKSAMNPGAIYISLYNEIFLNDGNPVYDRNRIYGAAGLVMNKNIRAEIGFMSQIFESSHRNQFQLSVFNNTPFFNND
jgi:hypothetical protein